MKLASLENPCVGKTTIFYITGESMLNYRIPIFVCPKNITETTVVLFLKFPLVADV